LNMRLLNLRSYGLNEGINEVIATTISSARQPNAAPIGLIVKRGKVSARIYKNTATYRNVLDAKALIGNIVDDPMLFVTTAFSDLSKRHYCFKKNLTIPVLQRASAWVLFECKIRGDEEPARISLMPKKGAVVDRKVLAINRALYAVIEAAIHATRYRATGEEKYREWMEHYRTIVQKCGSRREKMALARIEQFMGE